MYSYLYFLGWAGKKTVQLSHLSLLTCFVSYNNNNNYTQQIAEEKGSRYYKKRMYPFSYLFKYL